MNGFWNRHRGVIALMISLLMYTVPALAQNACTERSESNTGGFTVQPSTCVNRAVTITNPLAGLQNVRYVYQYDGTAGIPTGIENTSNVYTSPGSYTILQVAAGPNATGTLACRVVEVLPDRPIAFSLTSCGDRTVKLTYSLDEQTFRYNNISITWGDGSTSVIPLNGNLGPGTATRTYATAGTKTVQVVGGYTIGCGGRLASQQITVQNVAAINPVIRALTSGPASATIDYQGTTGSNVELYRKDPGQSAYVPTGLVGTSGGVFTVSASPAQVTCFQLVAKESCAATERRSTEVCSLVLTATPGDQKNVLKWNAYAGVGGTFVRYFVYKNGPPAFSTNGRLVDTYTDNVNIACGKQDCYVLEATINNPNTSSNTVVRSLSTCVTGISNATVVAPTAAYVSVQNGGVNVQATLPTVGLPSPYTVIVSRSEGGGSAFSPLGEATNGTYLDAAAQTATQSYCYQVAVRNTCGVLSRPTAPACSILLSRTANGGLSWTQASPFANGPAQNYQVIFIDPLTGLSDKTPTISGGTTTYTPDPNSQVTQYQLVGISSQGIESYSNPVEVELGLKVFLPNAFAPASADPKNSSFMAQGLTAFWNTFELTIFSRWGAVVFSTTDKNSTGWNGDVNGAPAQPGQYGYRIRVVAPNGQLLNRTGQVLLIR